MITAWSGPVYEGVWQLVLVAAPAHPIPIHVAIFLELPVSPTAAAPHPDHLDWLFAPTAPPLPIVPQRNFVATGAPDPKHDSENCTD